MAWCDVVCYVNEIVGKLCLFGGGGGMVFCCLQLPCRDFAESINRSAGINPLAKKQALQWLEQQVR